MSIRVLIVEDSPVVREFLNHILSSDAAIQVVGAVRDGREALQSVQNLKPDIITMDINMPGMDGYEVTQKIMETHPTPIVIVSASIDARQVATTFRAIEAGALAAVQKPAGIGHPEYEETAKALIKTVKLMSEVKVVRRWPRLRKPGSPPPDSVSGNLPNLASNHVEIVAMGASTGGPPVLQSILSALPEDFPAPVLIVQHIAPGFIRGFAHSLAPSCKLPVRVAGQGDVLQPGHVYLAPDSLHMGIGKGRRIELVSQPPVEGMRPSVSYLFESVAEAFGHKAVGVLLTGMGRDGAEGLRRMREKGAVTIAQDKESCVVFGMPAEAIRLGAASHVLSPDRIVSVLTKLAGVKTTLGLAQL